MGIVLPKSSTSLNLFWQSWKSYLPRSRRTEPVVLSSFTLTVNVNPLRTTLVTLLLVPFPRPSQAVCAEFLDYPATSTVIESETDSDALHMDSDTCIPIVPTPPIAVAAQAPVVPYS